MGINLRRLHIRMTEQLLHRANVLATFQEMSRKRMAKGVRRRWLDDPCSPYRHTHCTLNGFLMQVMTEDPLRARILRATD